MKVYAYCAASYRESVRRATGVNPDTCPPLRHRVLGLAFYRRLEEADFVYFKLHGMAGQPFWYGDHWATAVSADQVRCADLIRTVVFAGNCHLPDSPMLVALLESGAVVIGGEGVNYAHPDRVEGADLLGLWVRRLLSLGFTVERNLAVAKQRLRMTVWTRAAQRRQWADALAFKVWRPAQLEDSTVRRGI
jgi:hypothetical protein